jgi:hypothetical protein
VKPILRCRRFAGIVAACLLLGACADPDVSVKATDFAEDDTAAYLILSDQLQRVRNVLKKPTRVCAATFAGRYDGIEPVPSYVMDRLESEQATAKIRLNVISTFERPVHYVRDKGPFTPEATELLVYVRPGGGLCGEWYGGMYNQGNLDRSVGYNVVVEDGVARLTGGRGCAASLSWYRQ